jgi:hypothetical protein
MCRGSEGAFVPVVADPMQMSGMKQPKDCEKNQCKSFDQDRPKNWERIEQAKAVLDSMEFVLNSFRFSFFVCQSKSG